MKRHLLGVLLFVVFCVLGVYISPLWFDGTAIGHGVLIEDHDVTTVSVPYESSQFEMGYSSLVCFICAEKPEKAIDYFHKELESAIEVIEQTQKFDNKGVEVANRAVAKFYSKEINEYYYLVISVEDGILFQVSSKSLRHVLEFEKYPDRRY